MDDREVIDNIEPPTIACKRYRDEGFDLSRFIEVPPEEFICVICGCVVREPLECSDCGSLYCSSCKKVNNSRPAICLDFTRRRACPSCNSIKSPRKPSRILLKMIKELVVSCKYASVGCSFMSTIEDMDDHQKSCPMKPVVCANSSFCSKEGKRETFRMVRIESSNYTRRSEYVCSEICQKLLEFKQLVTNKQYEKAVKEFYRLACEVEELKESESKNV